MTDTTDPATPAKRPRTGPKARARFLLKLLAPGRPVQIADVGARMMRGGAPYDLLMKLDGAAHLSGFEPEAEAFERLVAEAPPNATCYQTAVGKPGPATFYSHKIGSLSSVFRFSASAAAYLGKVFWVKRPIEEIPVDLVALDQIESFPRLDLLKMDAQGAEFDILQGAKQTLAEAVCVIPEVRFYRMYEGEPTWADVDAELRAQGFVLHKFLHQKAVTLPTQVKPRFRKGKVSQLLDGDAVYIRNLEAPEAVSADQLKMLALIADTVIDSPDLCAYCLDLLWKKGILKKNASARYADRLPEDVTDDAEPEAGRDAETEEAA